jgi:hypothetical protein
VAAVTADSTQNRVIHNEVGKLTSSSPPRAQTNNKPAWLLKLQT